MENHAKIIFHIDMNAFFCSVACLLYPHLRGTAFAIGRENTYKGVISTASYEARALGIHSAQPIAEAYRIKPDLRIVHVDYSIYNEYHKKFVNLIKEYTNIIEVASIDEVYADMTDISKKKHPIVLAKEIQLRLLKEHGLPCSIGIAPTLFLAKMASDIKKPLGLTVIRKREVKEILYPLPVKDIFGIGKKTFPKLIEKNINTIGDFMNPLNKDIIINTVGENIYNYAYNHILGNSSNVVDPYRYDESKSISTSETFDVPLISFDEILIELRRMTKEVYKRMIKDNCYTKTITITLRDTDFNTITRQITLDEYIDSFDEIFDYVTELLEENIKDKAYRLIGVGVSNLVKEDKLPKEYNLFTLADTSNKEIVIDNLINDFQAKFGKNALFRRKK